ncbi:D-ribose-binding periplasmic protein precursor [Maioricimonas rarisocia]|uniref:D-ribose-binding periplasmic protein n=1 Tax=Maioricimonas rarisocia TaxID=2528026 RepID=A0A517ZF88_9PLAN|nr:substrate-binding domain-containing protein [Maioricimonas rarisocia]QDU41131.1 D-ribose-binding periplasmic protein precursor [Maioricimonas rarisocia]
MMRYAKSVCRWPLAWMILALPLMVGCPGEVPSGGNGAAGGNGETKRIVILTNGDDPFWDACEAGAFKAEEELGLAEDGLAVTFERADFTVKGQVDKLKQYALQSDIVALGISVYKPDSKQIADELRKLRERGVKVVTIDGDIDREQFRDARFAYLGTDNIVGGRELGRATAAVLPEGGQFAFFVGSTSAANAIARMQGFIEGAGPAFEEVTRLEDGGDRPKARKNVQDALDQYPEIDALVGIWAYNTPQIVAVVEDQNIRDKTKVSCFDAAEISIREMKDGNVDVMVVQNPYQMGHVGVRLLKAMVEENQEFIDEMYPDYSQEGEGDIYRTELRVVVPDEGSPITPDLFEEGTTFMKLSEFEEWLAERNLTSS